jgi:hypothetical protein
VAREAAAVKKAAHTGAAIVFIPNGSSALLS